MRREMRVKVPQVDGKSSELVNELMELLGNMDVGLCGKE